MMKAIEFEAQVEAAESGHSVTLPPGAAASLSAGQSVRVILLIPDSGVDDGDAAWRRLGLEQFAAGYDEGDAIYDNTAQLPSR
jgi:hypothetical protein